MTYIGAKIKDVDICDLIMDLVITISHNLPSLKN